MRKVTFYLIIIVFLASCRAYASDEAVSANARTDKTRITIGDQVNFEVTLVSPLDYKFIVPEKQAEIGPWEIRDLKISQDRKDKLYNNLNYTLTAFTTGQLAIPELTFQFSGASGSTFTVTTQSVIITVESVLGLVKGPAGLRDIKPPLSLNIPAGVYLFWAFILAAAGFGFWYWRVNYRKRVPALPLAPAEPYVPPSQTALEEMERLKISGLVKEGRVKEFYIVLTDIIRKYLGAVYSIDTADKTTGEIYRELRRCEEDKRSLVFIKEFLEECDLVKFAKYMPDEKTAWEDFDNAIKIIKDYKIENL